MQGRFGNEAQARRRSRQFGSAVRFVRLVLLAAVVWASPALVKAQRAHPGVVRVIVPERGGMSLGSGTLVGVQGDQGLVLTNWHVIKTARNNTVVAFPDGFKSKARILKADKKWDLAALAIARPHVAPVRIAALPPRKGEWLTIAGYGSGKFRAARGRCSGYLSPAQNHPAEMVEMTAVARQGDSGGPMLNDRGELAAVLFGAKSGGFSLFGGGGGFTAGSHVGRVRKFLAGVWPADSVPSNLQRTPQYIARAPASKPPRSPARRPQTRAPQARISRLVPIQEPRSETGKSSVRQIPQIGATEPRQPQVTRPDQPRSTTELQRIPQRQPQALPIPDPDPEVQELQPIHLQDLVGNTLFEQLKTVLAVIGAIVLAIRFIRREE